MREREDGKIKDFELELEKKDVMMYRDEWVLSLLSAPKMLYLFIFRFAGVLYRRIAFTFGWGMSVMWLKLMQPVVKYTREMLEHRALPKIEYFLAVPPPGRQER